MACYQFQNELGCVLLSVNESYTGVPLSSDGSMWRVAPALRTSQTTWAGVQGLCETRDARTCFGLDVAVNQLAVAVSAVGQDNSRFVQVHCDT
jgi:hypothetical protein